MGQRNKQDKLGYSNEIIFHSKIDLPVIYKTNIDC